MQLWRLSPDLQVAFFSPSFPQDFSQFPGAQPGAETKKGHYSSGTAGFPRMAMAVLRMLPTATPAWVRDIHRGEWSCVPL
jgi:hypothetical protein